MARELVPRRVIISQSIVALDKHVDELRKAPKASANYVAQINGPSLSASRQLKIDGQPSVEFMFETGFRLIRSELNKDTENDQANGATDSNADEPGDNGDELPSALILLTMRLIMLKTADKEYAEKDLMAFGSTSGAFQIWPYFREFVHSAFVRAGLDTPAVSMFTLRD